MPDAGAIAPSVRNSTSGGMGMYLQTRLLCAVVTIYMLCLTRASLGAAELSLTKSSFGATKEGQPADLYTLTNGSGFVAKVTNYGAIIVGLDVPDKAGTTVNVIQGFGS